MVLVYMLTFGGILMGFMLPYIAAPWIRHGYGISKWIGQATTKALPELLPSGCI